MNLVAFDDLDYILEQEVEVLHKVMGLILQVLVQVDSIGADQA